MSESDKMDYSAGGNVMGCKKVLSLILKVKRKLPKLRGGQGK